MDPHVLAQSDIAHCLRRNENELATGRRSSRINQHLHTDIAVDLVHEHITAQLLVPDQQQLRTSFLQLTIHPSIGSVIP
jgi:hypothetical protein